MSSMTAHSLDNTERSTFKDISAQRLEQCFWLFLLVVCNHTLWNGQVAEQYVFVPALVNGGEWIRVFLSPFTHVSWYHLVLDATAFLLLWIGLAEKRCWGRGLYLAGCWIGSLVVPLMFSSQLYERGLCGLSGIAHGLFAITALEMFVCKERKESRLLGGVLFAGLLAKIIWEILPGGNLIAHLHLGDVGVPIVTSHLGGIVGGCFAFGLLRYLSSIIQHRRVKKGISK